MSVSVVTSIMTSMAKSLIMNVMRHAPEIPVKSVEVLGNFLSMMQVKLCTSQFSILILPIIRPNCSSISNTIISPRMDSVPKSKKYA